MAAPSDVMSLSILFQLTKKQRRQFPQLATLLLRKLETAFPRQPFRAPLEPVHNLGQISDQLVVRLASPHPEVPAMWFILFQADKITAHWGIPCTGISSGTISGIKKV